MKRLAWWICLVWVPVGFFLKAGENLTAPHELLRNYSGDYTDTDGDGMTDAAESKYGYDALDPQSFPKYDYGASPEVVYPIANSSFNDAVVCKTDTGIRLKWDNKQPPSSYSRFSLTLEDGDRQLYYGGHEWSEATVDYGAFDLNGTEVLNGRFSEYDPASGELVREYDWFEIDLSDYPVLKDTKLAEPSDRITFRFDGFETDLRNKYEGFLGKVMPIFLEVAGNPAETFVCTFVRGEDGGNSWVTLDHGRTIVVDGAWIPRLIVHELIHAWKGKYAFSYTGEDWSFEDDLNGFEEIAEGLAYEILHDYVEAYPKDDLSRLILEGGPWWNWSSQASNFDLVKHQRHTGAGTFWSGESLFQNDRYSISAMLIQVILQHEPQFYRKVMRAYYDRIESDPTFRPSREGLLELWSSQIPKINGIDSRAYLEGLPILNGTKLKQGYYPVIYQSESYSHSTTKTIFGSYALDGYLWWFSRNSKEEIAAFDLPSWVKHNLSSDGYHYADSNGQPYEVKVRNVFGEKVLEHKGVLDAGYQDENKTIPNNLFTERIDELNSENLPRGLYLETLEFTEIAKHTDEASESFYSFGYQDFTHKDDQYSLFIGVDSKFPESATVRFGSLSFELSIVNGCAILQTDRLALDAEGILAIELHSKEETCSYSRALVNAGSYDGKRHQQFLVIDRDFDGVEDLYDEHVDEDSIAKKYMEYEKSYPDRFEDSDSQPNDLPTSEKTSRQNTDSQSSDSSAPQAGARDQVSESSSTDLPSSEGREQEQVVTSFWLTGQDLGAGWKYLDWFGYYLVSDSSSQWVYHSVLGWVYLTEMSMGSTWFYADKVGWVWTLPDVFPQGYLFKKGSWVYLEQSKYFDYGQSEWLAE
jgi:hypothetical protein